jgi:hypothetical protein
MLGILVVMAAEPSDLFDVFVVGSVDASPAGVSRLAQMVATRHGAPVESVLKALSARSLRAGRDLTGAQAELLAQQLNALGAITDVRPGGGAGPAPGPLTAAGPAPAGRTIVGGFAAPGSASGVTDAPPALRPLGPSGPPSLKPLTATLPAPPGLKPLAAAPPAPPPADPFAPPPSGPKPAPSRAAPAPAAAGHDPFAAPDAGELRLELARGAPGGPPSGEGARAAVAGASGLETGKLVGTSSSSHLGVGDEEAGAAAGKLATVRCPRHGLYYDKRKASGCRKCLEGARTQAAAFEHARGPFRLDGFRDNPPRRAFVGLAFALVVGFLAAAFHAKGPGAVEVRRLRHEQDELSQRAGTEEVLRRFDDLEEQVRKSHRSAMRTTALIWLVAGAGVMFGWYKIT